MIVSVSPMSWDQLSYVVGFSVAACFLVDSRSEVDNDENWWKQNLQNLMM